VCRASVPSGRLFLGSWISLIPQLSAPSVAPTAYHACSCSSSTACPTAPTLAPAPHARPTAAAAAPALPPAPPGYADSTASSRRSAGPWRGSPPTLPPAIYGCGAPMQMVEEAAPGCDACCKCIFQMFQMYVAKAYHNVACVAIVVHVCCKRLSPMFHLFFQTYVAIMFIWMLHMFHTYVATVLSGYSVCLQWFSSVSDVCFKCFVCL
jgi:hypothetical protein